MRINPKSTLQEGLLAGRFNNEIKNKEGGVLPSWRHSPEFIEERPWGLVLANL